MIDGELNIYSEICTVQGFYKDSGIVYHHEISCMVWLLFAWEWWVHTFLSCLSFSNKHVRRPLVCPNAWSLWCLSSLSDLSFVHNWISIRCAINNIIQVENSITLRPSIPSPCFTHSYFFSFSHNHIGEQDEIVSSDELYNLSFRNE